ncbi:hypothetical protein ACQJBY_035151 [Aegilops geniculata]
MPHTSRTEEDRISAGGAHLPACQALALSLEIHASSLRIKKMGRSGSSTDVFLTKFVSCLLLLRDPGSTLDEAEIEYARHFEDDHIWISTWIRHALSCQAQVLTVKFPLQGYLDGPPLVSRYLRRLQVFDVSLKSKFLNFSSCLTLEYLKIEESNLKTASSILSQSLKHLSIKHCYFKIDGRVRISVPNLVWLQLISCGGRVPLLESMLSLETAVVRPEICLKDYCLEGVAEGCCGTCADCCGNDDHNGGCVLFGGLSRAKNLELIADPEMFIFRRDLRWCPTFSKLKTLLLNEWSVQPDLCVLVCMLEHSPVLEHLTLQLRKQEKPTCSVEENAGLMEKPAAI